MLINVRFVGYLARRIGKEVAIELEEGTNFADAVKKISKDYGLGSVSLERGDDQGYLVILLNGKSQKPNTMLKENDEIAFLPTMAGG